MPDRQAPTCGLSEVRPPAYGVSEVRPPPVATRRRWIRVTPVMTGRVRFARRALEDSPGAPGAAVRTVILCGRPRVRNARRRFAQYRSNVMMLVSCVVSGLE